MLKSLNAETRRRDRVIVVDGGSDSIEDVVTGIPGLKPIRPKTETLLGQAKKLGDVGRGNDDIADVGFLDDDVILTSGPSRR